MDKDGVKGLWSVGSVPFQVVQLNSDGGLDSRESGNDGLMTVIPPKKPLNNRRPEIYSGYAGLGRDSGPENLSLSGFL